MNGCFVARTQVGLLAVLAIYTVGGYCVIEVVLPKVVCEPGRQGRLGGCGIEGCIAARNIGKTPGPRAGCGRGGCINWGRSVTTQAQAAVSALGVRPYPVKYAIKCECAGSVGRAVASGITGKVSCSRGVSEKA